jgi:hypothetical protein
LDKHSDTEADTNEIVGRIESSTDDEIFDFIDNELRVSQMEEE